MPKIDLYLPTYDISEKYHTYVDAPPQVTYATFKKVDFSKSWIIRKLLGLRKMPPSKHPRFIEFVFSKLSEDPPNEIVFGRIDTFLSKKEGPLKVESDKFESFNTSGYIKVVWNFTFTEKNGGTLVATETRGKCIDPQNRWKYRLYFLMFVPLSGIIRKEVLRLVKKEASLRPSS